MKSHRKTWAKMRTKPFLLSVTQDNSVLSKTWPCTVKTRFRYVCWSVYGVWVWSL